MEITSQIFLFFYSDKSLVKLPYTSLCCISVYTNENEEKKKRIETYPMYKGNRLLWSAQRSCGSDREKRQFQNLKRL